MTFYTSFIDGQILSGWHWSSGFFCLAIQYRAELYHLFMYVYANDI